MSKEILKYMTIMFTLDQWDLIHDCLVGYAYKTEKYKGAKELTNIIKHRLEQEKNKPIQEKKRAKT